MHYGMPYDLIQGQGHETFKVRNLYGIQAYFSFFLKSRSQYNKW